MSQCINGGIIASVFFAQKKEGALALLSCFSVFILSKSKDDNVSDDVFYDKKPAAAPMSSWSCDVYGRRRE
jgi:hypothetical protein